MINAQAKDEALGLASNSLVDDSAAADDDEDNAMILQLLPSDRADVKTVQACHNSMPMGLFQRFGDTNEEGALDASDGDEVVGPPK